MTWYRVKVYQALDADVERLMVDKYVMAADEHHALDIAAETCGSDGFIKDYSGAACRNNVNSHRSAIVAEHDEQTGVTA